MPCKMSSMNRELERKLAVWVGQLLDGMCSVLQCVAVCCSVFQCIVSMHAFYCACPEGDIISRQCNRAFTQHTHRNIMFTHHAPTPAHTAQTPTCMRMYTCARIHACICTHTCTNTRTRTYEHTHTYTHTNTHTHTHSHSPFPHSFASHSSFFFCFGTRSLCLSLFCSLLTHTLSASCWNWTRPLLPMQLMPPAHRFLKCMYQDSGCFHMCNKTFVFLICACATRILSPIPPALRFKPFPPPRALLQRQRKSTHKTDREMGECEGARERQKEHKTEKEREHNLFTTLILVSLFFFPHSLFLVWPLSLFSPFFLSVCKRCEHKPPIISNLNFQTWAHRPSIKGTKPLLIVASSSSLPISCTLSLAFCRSLAVACSSSLSLRAALRVSLSLAFFRSIALSKTHSLLLSLFLLRAKEDSELWFVKNKSHTILIGQTTHQDSVKNLACIAFYLISLACRAFWFIAISVRFWNQRPDGIVIKESLNNIHPRI